jgi:hypothetical protein
MSGPQTKSKRRLLLFWLGVSLAALILRLAVLPLSPMYGYYGDHDDYARWGIQAADQGVLTLYDHPPPRWNMQRWQGDRWAVRQRGIDRTFNYPPLSGYLFWISGHVFKAISGERLVNTITARAITSSWSIIADFILAWGCAAIVALYKPGWPARWTYALMLFAPPFWLDSVLWGQTDSVLLAPAVWMLWAMLRPRWMMAGLLLGVCAAIKPQAILFLPVWALAIVISRPIRKPVISFVIAVGALLLMALPFTLHSGWAWLRLSYVDNLLHAYALTTLKAFNIWYLDALLCESLDVWAKWMGIPKDWWGKVFLGLVLVAGFVGVVWRWRHKTSVLIPWTTFVTLACVMLPTRVHERYILLVLPFLTTLTFLRPRHWPGLLAILVVATCQLTWPNWMRHPAGSWEQTERRVTRAFEDRMAKVPPQRQATVPSVTEHLRLVREQHVRERAASRRVEWGATILALLATAYICRTIATTRPP